MAALVSTSTAICIGSVAADTRRTSRAASSSRTMKSPTESPVTGASFLSTTLAYTVRSVACAHTGCAGRRVAIVNTNNAIGRIFTSP